MEEGFMGMTNEQFQRYEQNLLRTLQRIQRDIEKEGKSEELETLVKDISDSLRKS